MKIILPLPPNSLSPNSRCNRFAVAADKKVYRKRACLACDKFDSPMLEMAYIKVTKFRRTKSKPDGDNLLASMKAAIDGIVDACVVVDDNYNHVRYLPCEFELDRQNPRIQIEIIPAPRGFKYTNRELNAIDLNVAGYRKCHDNDELKSFIEESLLYLVGHGWRSIVDSWQVGISG